MKPISVALLLLVMVISLFAQPTSGNASDSNRIDNWMFFWGNKHWYKIIPVSPDMTWHAMRDTTIQIGGHLVTISSQGENNALAKFVNPNLIFLGATDEGTEGNWSWTTGESWDVTAWKPGHPNSGSPNANFLALDPSDSLWVDTTSILDGTQILVVEYDSCCRETLGDVNCDGIVDIADLTDNIGFLFIHFAEPCCIAAGNLDGSGGVDIADLTFLIDHLFINFPPLPPCR